MHDFYANLRPASFRGVPFKVMDSDDGRGRATVIHEFPMRDQVYVEDLGLPDSKTGFKNLHLSAPAIEVLSSLPFAEKSGYVFPSLTAASGHIEGLRKSWLLVCEAAKLQGRWRIHDLRHGFASAAVNSGASLPVIGVLLGHS